MSTKGEMPKEKRVSRGVVTTKMKESWKGKFVTTDKNLTTIKKVVGFVGREDKSV